MLCEKCGAELPAGTKFCIKCGYPAEKRQGTTQADINAYAKQDKKGLRVSRRTVSARLAVSIVAALALCFAAFASDAGRLWRAAHSAEGLQIDLAAAYGLLAENEQPQAAVLLAYYELQYDIYFLAAHYDREDFFQMLNEVYARCSANWAQLDLQKRQIGQYKRTVVSLCSLELASTAGAEAEKRRS